MTYILTLITNPKELPLDEKIINYAFLSLEKKKANIENLQWLAPNEACDIIFNCENIKQLALNLDKYPIDYAILEPQNRRKKMLISDMDSTIIEQECIDELADVLGLKEKVAQITAKAMNGELDFKAALQERVALLKDLPEQDLQKVYDTKITFTVGAKELVSTMRKNNAACILVSGGFTFFTDRVAKEIGFDSNFANILGIANGKLTGQVREPILDKDSKAATLLQKCKELTISPSDVVAVGDGANDIPMLKKAGLGVAFKAMPNVQKDIPIHINHTSLKSLLYLQGYRQEEIIS